MGNTRSSRRILAAVGTVATLMIGGCAQPIELDAAQSAVAFDRLDALSQTIGGTPEQRTAGEVLQYHAYQDPVQECMKKAGFVYTPPAFVDPYAGRAVIHMGIGTGAWLAPLDAESLGVADAAVRLSGKDVEKPNPSYDNLSPSQKDKYNAALTGCIPRETPDVNFPPTSVTLSAAFAEMLDEVSQDPRVKSAAETYPTCMAGKGFAVKNYDDLLEQMQARVNGVQVPQAGAGGSAAWLEVVAHERAAAESDSVCRRPAFETALGLTMRRIDAFEKEHADELTRVQEEWDRTVLSARAYPEF